MDSHADLYAKWQAEMRTLIGQVLNGETLSATPELARMAAEVARLMKEQPPMSELEVNEWAKRLAKRLVDSERV